MDGEKIPKEKTPEEKKAILELREPVKTPSWVIPLIFVVITVFILLFVSRSCNNTKPSTATVQESAING